jgi:malonyl CoA-acyl carrier protein transacylase
LLFHHKFAFLKSVQACQVRQIKSTGSKKHLKMSVLHHLKCFAPLSQMMLKDTNQSSFMAKMGCLLVSLHLSIFHHGDKRIVLPPSEILTSTKFTQPAVLVT